MVLPDYGCVGLSYPAWGRSKSDLAKELRHRKRQITAGQEWLLAEGPKGEKVAMPLPAKNGCTVGEEALPQLGSFSLPADFWTFLDTISSCS